MHKLGKNQSASQTPFDNSTNGFTATETQAAIEEVKNNAAISASPGFTWSRSGNVPSNTWLLNDAVPSNRSGRTIMMSSAKLERMSVATEDIGTYDIEIYLHDGNEINLTLLHSVSVINTRSAQFTIAAIPATTGRQMALKLSTGSAKNLVIGLILKGNA